MDIADDFVADALNNIDLTDGGIAGFIVGDEKEIIQGADQNE